MNLSNIEDENMNNSRLERLKKKKEREMGKEKRKKTKENNFME